MEWTAKMMSRFLHIIYLGMLTFALQTCLPLGAQVPVDAPSEETPLENAWSDQEWEELQKRIDFGEAAKKEEEDQKSKEHGEGDSTPDSEEQNSSVLSSEWGKAIAYICIAAMLLALIWVLYKGQWNQTLSTHADSAMEEVHEDEVDVIETDLDRLLKRALEDQNWRLAMRLHFLITLKRMHEQKWIEWQRHKTNRDYKSEISTQPWAKQFSTLVLTYEIVWYGERQMSREEYQRCAGIFDQFQMLSHAE